MISHLALKPDLDECLLEERTLLYAGPGLYASQFIPSSGSNPSFVVSGFQLGSSPGSGGGISPGPQFFYLQIGLNSSSNGGVRLGGSFSIYNPLQALPSVQGAAVGSGPGSGTIGGTRGYGGSISSGYNTSLNSSNNFGMGGAAVGSVTAHVSGSSDPVASAQGAGASNNTVAQDDTSAPAANPAPPSPGQTLFSTQDRLLGKGLGNSGGLLIGPGGNPAPARSMPSRP